MDVYIERVKKEYKGRELFDLKDIEFKSEKINVLMGRNGIGKTTLLNIIAGLDIDYTGRILYDGAKLDREKMKEITLVSQKPYILKLSVYENLAYPLKLRRYKKSDIEQKVEFYIEKLKLQSLRNQSGDSLSGGEMQRVSLARSLIFSPKLLLLDEYTASIDENSMDLMESAVLEYRDSSRANVILITHSKDQADRIGDRLIEMK